MHCPRDGTSETFYLGTHRSGTLYHVILLSVTGAAGAGLPVGRIRIRDVAAKVQETLALQGGVQVPTVLIFYINVLGPLPVFSSICRQSVVPEHSFILNFV
jgi:hypothetical protein